MPTPAAAMPTLVRTGAVQGAPRKPAMAGFAPIWCSLWGAPKTVAGRKRTHLKEMTMPRLAPFISVSVWALAIYSSLALAAAVSADFPTGTYAAKEVPFTVTFDAQGQFQVLKGETLEVTGKYSLKTGQLQLTDSRGPWACAKTGEQTGTYAWKYENAVLTFSKVADQCADRVKSLVDLAWQRQGMPKVKPVERS
jgi:hypothetical protein